MTHTVRVLPENVTLTAESGDDLLDLLRAAGLAPDAVCGGEGRCGQCRVTVDGEERLACRVSVDRDMTVVCPRPEGVRVLTESDPVPVCADSGGGCRIAFDIGTTTLVGSLSDGSGRELAVRGMLNPQTAYGADVVSRLRSAAAGTLHEQSELVREAMSSLAEELCRVANISVDLVDTVCVVGNSAMQQLFSGMGVDNLIRPPFVPALRDCAVSEASALLPPLKNARLLTVPDIAAYVGADTVGCILSSGLHKSEELTLLVDIGTNGELVLGNRDRLLCCAAAAGPALEGACIQFGMRAATGAIDHVRVIDGALSCHVIGETEARGVCGSGLIDAAACALELGLLDRRGRIIEGDRIALCDGVYLTQEDIRQLQLAKAAIAAGIELLTDSCGVSLDAIDRVLLAGAFGSFLSADAACRIGLIPKGLRGKLRSVGNAALAGAKLMAADREAYLSTAALCRSVEYVDLGSAPSFRRGFAKNMYFE